MTFALFEADQPRFVFPENWLRIEGQRTNAVRNPRAEGAVSGSPGTLPTNWFAVGTGGVNFNVAGSGVENGIPYADLRVSGTSTDGTQPLVRPDQVYPTAAQNEIWTHSAFVRLVGGTLAGITSVNMIVTEWTAAGVFVTQGFAVAAVGPGPLGTGRIALTRTLTGATTGRVGAQMTFAPQIGVAIDATFRIGLPQLELGEFASSPILPPAGAPAVATRGADLVSAPLSALNLPASGACTVLLRGMIPQNAGAVAQILVHVDDGTTSNRYRLFNEVSGATIAVGRDLAGAAAFTSIGTMTAGTAFRAGFTINGSGRIAGSLNGGAVAAQTGGPTSGLTTLRLGGNPTGAGALFGTLGLVRVLPNVLSDGDLQSAVAGL